MRGCTCRGLTLCNQCATLAARAGVIPPRYDSAHQLPEEALQEAVRRLAREHGWLYYHTFDSRRSPSGFVDVVLAKVGAPLLMVELKTDVGQVTPAQQAWLTALAGCTGVVADIWRPAQLQEIVQRLRG